MTRKVRYHIEDEAGALSPNHLTKEAFGRRLQRLMFAKGWNQSELARQADIPRDSVSTYIRGRSFPTPTTLQKLAKVLGVEHEALLPNTVESAIAEDNPSFEMKASTARPGFTWLKVNRLVRFSTAAEISTLLARDDADRQGEGE